MKRKLTILLTAAAALAVLTACGNGGDTATDTTAQQAEVAPTVEEGPIEEPAPSEENVEEVDSAEEVAELITAEIPVEEVPANSYLCDTFVELITDENLNGMTGEFLVDFLVNYYSDPEGYESKLTEIFGEFVANDNWHFRAETPNLLERGIEDVGFTRSNNPDNPNRVGFSIDDVDYDSYLSANPRFAGHTIFDKENWDTMAANWIEGETTYEEIAAELGDPGCFSSIMYYPYSNGFDVYICWTDFADYENYNRYRYRTLCFDENGVLD
ncbi:MAG: hypothetical protein ACI4DW_08040 [Lachnospiraceae bacterium]